MNMTMFDANIFGITFEPDYQVGEDCIWVTVRNQSDEVTNFVRTFEPLLPAKYNNVIVKCGVNSFMDRPFLLKYISP